MACCSWNSHSSVIKVTVILSNPLINASIFYFCYALEDRLQFLCSPLGLVMAIPLTQYVPSSKRGQGTLIYVGEDRWGRTIARSPLFIYFYFFLLACIFANFFPFWISSRLHTDETIFQSHTPFILEVISLHYTASFIHIFENTMWSRLPRNLQLLPRARLVVFVTAYLWSPDKPLLAVQNSTFPQVH